MADTRREQDDGTPKDFPQTTPPPQPLDYSFTLQAVMELQKSTGQLKESIDQLRKAVEGHGDQLNTISHRLYAAAVVIAVLIALGAFFLDKMWDTLVELFKLVQ